MGGGSSTPNYSIEDTDGSVYLCRVSSNGVDYICDNEDFTQYDYTCSVSVNPTSRLCVTQEVNLAPKIQCFGATDSDGLYYYDCETLVASPSQTVQRKKQPRIYDNH